jgi:hypothetical protein
MKLLMAKRTTNKALSDKILSKLGTVWGAIIAGCTILGFGVGAGSYVTDVFSKIEINEINQKHNGQLYQQRIEFDKQMKELVHQKNMLEVENGKLKK